jgi:hypothetical protein
MRNKYVPCRELSDQLLRLAYDDLDPADRAGCEEHLAGCPDCRAEWAALRNTQRLLDLAPERQTQIDLAAVCLRVAARERRSSLLWRVGLGVAGIAASIAAILCISIFDIDVQPGRVVVAWRHSAPAPAEPGRNRADIEVAAQKQTAGQQTDEPLGRIGTGAASFTDLQTALLDWEGRTLATGAFRSRRALSHANWNVMRYAQPVSDAARVSERAATYGDLRRDLLEENRNTVQQRSPRGA